MPQQLAAVLVDGKPDCDRLRHASSSARYGDRASSGRGVRGHLDLHGCVPCPEAVRLIDELKPPVAVVARLTRPSPPRVTVIVLGLAASVKLPVGPVTVRLTVVVAVVLPEVPVTVIV